MTNTNKTTIRKFVIQEHTTAADKHWDIMLQSDNWLQTWRLNCPPEKISEQPVNAEKIFDHPLKFLTYQGPVQNQTGTVYTVEKGTYIIENQTEKQMELNMHGKILNGKFTLTKTNLQNWLFQKNTKHS